MSRIGQQVITVPAQVEVVITGNQIKVKGPAGQLAVVKPTGIDLDQQADQLTVSRADDSRRLKANHGLIRSLVANMIVGVTDGFTKQLTISGIGYRVAQNGSRLVFSLGFSHPVEYLVPDDIKVTVAKDNTITVAGIDKQRVGQIAAEIRSLKKPEPYKGKGIKYIDEVIRRKAGKGAKEA